MQVPNGLLYYEAASKWSTPPFASFDTIVQMVIAHRNANAYLRDSLGLSVDPGTVAQQVDEQNAQRCHDLGWLDYIVGGTADPPPPSFHQPQPLASLAQGVAGIKKLAAGAALLFDWEESGEPPVAAELSAARAKVCEPCPKNDPSNLSDWFTHPVSENIRKKLGRLHGMKLTTPSDEKLGVCSACLCPLKLKVHTPKHLIDKRMTDATRAELDPVCWILHEK
jgi:hypothetical protein